MANNQNIYLYDGTFSGFLSCVFYAFQNKETPIDITTDDQTLFERTIITTDSQKAQRVEKWLKTLGQPFVDVVTLVFLSAEKGMELDLLELLKRANLKGRYILSDLNDPLIHKLVKLARAVKREAHRLIEFVRFSDHNGNLISTINPKYFVLPLISSHFENRFPNENFFIYDETHGAALAYTNHSSEIYPIDNFIEAPPTQQEQNFRNLWKLFYDTIEIKQRRNHKLRMQHLPKRFWRNITELKELTNLLE